MVGVRERTSIAVAWWAYRDKVVVAVSMPVIVGGLVGGGVESA